MLEVLEFVFSSFWIWLGSYFLIVAFANGAILALHGSRRRRRG